MLSLMQFGVEFIGFGLMIEGERKHKKYPCKYGKFPWNVCTLCVVWLPLFSRYLFIFTEHEIFQSTFFSKRRKKSYVRFSVVFCGKLKEKLLINTVPEVCALFYFIHCCASCQLFRLNRQRKETKPTSLSIGKWNEERNEIEFYALR